MEIETETEFAMSWNPDLKIKSLNLAYYELDHSSVKKYLFHSFIPNEFEMAAQFGSYKVSHLLLNYHSVSSFIKYLLLLFQEQLSSCSILSPDFVVDLESEDKCFYYNADSFYYTYSSVNIDSKAPELSLKVSMKTLENESRFVEINYEFYDQITKRRFEEFYVSLNE